MPRLYELVPVAVEAIEISPDSVHRAAIWCGGIEVEEIDALDDKIRFVGLNVPTISGVHRASQGDYVVKNNRGEFSVMSKAEFEEKYRQVG